MIRFGTGGWRAVIADDYTKENIRLLCGGLCMHMLKEGLEGAEICIGYDRRFLSKESAHWAAEVLVGYGFHVYMINRSSPTPLAMYTVKSKDLPYGLMVTASHNPAIYNGIKVFTRGGRDADRAVTALIEQQTDLLSPTQIKSMDYDAALTAGLITEANPANDYIDSILSLIDTESIKKAGLKIALDPMYGVSQTGLRTILFTCRCDVEVIHDSHDTLFGGKLPAPNEQTLIPLAHFVTDNHCDLGVATDGDADRLGVIDEFGNFVHFNKLLVLLYYYLLKYRGWHGPVVRNTSTTHMLDRVAAMMHEECYEVPVGFKWISSKMAETDAILGGESSGGLAVKGHISGKDGIYAASLLTEMIARTGKSLSALYQEIVSQIGELFYYDTDYRMTPARKEELKQFIFDQKQHPSFSREIAEVSYRDGCKIYFKDGGWVICRFSGTEPLLRVAAEASTEEEAQKSAEAWKAFLKL